jgi:hypothetical protein
MNYLLFVYYDNTVENPELMTNEIAKQISEKMTSKEAKYMFGDKHGIFHFASDMSIDDMSGWIDIINDNLNCFQYFLTPKPRNSASNIPKDNLDHLLSLKKTNPKKHKPTPPRIKYDFKPSKGEETFMDIADILFNLKRKEVCNMTLDDLLDKISQQGIDSLSELEKQKLDEYSKSL